jgi:HD-like signal output (HDOD) protein
MLKKTAFWTHVDRNPVAERPLLQVEFAHHLPGVPVLPATLLLLDLEVQEPCVDLRLISQLVLSDLGATVQILQLAGREYGNAEGCPTRIEDCISDLGLHACMEALSAETVAHDSRYKAIVETWAHSREIAQYSNLIAEEMPEVNPGEAYLVGLFHAIGSLPAVLGWDGSKTEAVDSALLGLKLAQKWSLPHFVLEFFETHMTGCQTLWSEILRTAHRRASRSSIDCPFSNDIRPLLLRGGEFSASVHDLMPLHRNLWADSDSESRPAA